MLKIFFCVEKSTRPHHASRILRVKKWIKDLASLDDAATHLDDLDPLLLRYSQAVHKYRNY